MVQSWSTNRFPPLLNTLLGEEADTYLWNVLPYLYELQAAPDGIDFEGQIFGYTERIKADIKQKLIDDPSLTWLNAKQRVREFVDEWIANSLNERQG